MSSDQPLRQPLVLLQPERADAVNTLLTGTGCLAMVGEAPWSPRYWMWAPQWMRRRIGCRRSRMPRGKSCGLRRNSTGHGLGLRNAYIHLLRSQKALLEERLGVMPDDETLKMLLDTMVTSLKAVEEAAESACYLLHLLPGRCGHSPQLWTQELLC